MVSMQFTGLRTHKSNQAIRKDEQVQASADIHVAMTGGCTYVDGVFPGLQSFCDCQHIYVGPVLPILVLL